MHKRWIRWVAVVAVMLMLAAMGMYVMTLDEAEQPEAIAPPAGDVAP